MAIHTLLLMLAVLRRLPYRETQFRHGEWNRARGDMRLQARQLRGKLVALVGLGAIGRQVAKRLQAFDTQVRYFDIRRPRRRRSRRSAFDNVANVARHAFRNIPRVLDGQPLPPADLVSSPGEG